MIAHPLMLIPIVSDFMVNICLLGAGLFLFVVALALCSYLLECGIRAFDAACNWLEYKLQRRKVRRRSLAHLERRAYRTDSINSSHPSRTAPSTQPTKPAKVLQYRARRPVDAREALRRSASQGEDYIDSPRGA